LVETRSLKRRVNTSPWLAVLVVWTPSVETAASVATRASLISGAAFCCGAVTEPTVTVSVSVVPLANVVVKVITQLVAAVSKVTLTWKPAPVPSSEVTVRSATQAPLTATDVIV
jgi:hypothetical protein